MTRVIIAGSRDLGDERVDEIIEAYFEGKNLKEIEIVSGLAQGVDSRGIIFAWMHKLKIHRFKAEWNKYNAMAGPIRNKKMAEFADELLLIWDGESKGSYDMKKQMLILNKPIEEIILKG